MPPHNLFPSNLLTFPTGEGRFILLKFSPICSCVSTYNLKITENSMYFLSSFSRFWSDLELFFMSQAFMDENFYLLGYGVT